MPPITIFQAFWQTARMGLFGATCFAIEKVIGEQIIELKNSYKSWIPALLGGAILYNIIDKIWDLTLFKIGKLRACGPVDAIFLYDEKGKQSNVAIVLNFKKFEDGQKMKEYMQQKIDELCQKIPNFYIRTKLQNFCGKWYFRYIQDEKEWDEMQEHLYIINNNKFNTQEELETFVCQEQQRDIDLGKWCPNVFYIIPNYLDDQSIVIHKFNHCCNDGLSMVSLYQALSVSQDFSQFKVNREPQLNVVQRICRVLLVPFSALQQAFTYMVLTPKEVNCIRQNNDISTRMNRIKKEAIPLKLFLNKCKELKCTYNEAFQSLIGQTTSQYMATKGQTDLTQVNLCSTFALRQLPSKMEEFPFYNNWVPVIHPIPLAQNFKDCLPRMKTILSKYKGNYPFLWGCHLLISMMTMTPYAIPKLFVNLQSSKATMSYSNMSGPKEPFIWNGSECNWFCAFLPAFGSSVCAITAFSQGDSIQMCIVSDTNSIDNPDLFMDLLEKNVSEFLGYERVQIVSDV